MKTLLAFVRKPNESEEFLRYVAGMGVNLGAKVNVQFVHTPENYTVGMADTSGYLSMQVKQDMDKLVETSKETLQQYAQSINQEISADVFIETSAQLGLPGDVAEDLVKKKLVDMVVLHGEKDSGFWFQSSGNMDVIEKVNCPVWVIPEGAEYKPYTEIVYATDYNREDVKSLKRLIATFPHYSPNITAFHVTDSVDFEERVKKAGFEEMLRNQIDYEPLLVRAVYQTRNDNLTELLNEYTLKSKADLLVLLKENKSFLKHIFNKSKTKSIVKSTQLPVLIYHEQ
ncbi:MAG TPA: hypothetical protein VEP89_06375 [Draconibacterium sp.]|nr:hypothetical protein [Draconibacterium sp.]